MKNLNFRGGVLRWILIIISGLVALVLLAVGGFYYVSGRPLARKYEIPESQPLYVAQDSVTLARGEHLVHAIAMCAECHGDHLEGKMVFDDPAFGKLYAPNITPGKGGLPKDFSITDFEHVLRHGVLKDGSSVWIMPSFHYCTISDDDVAALYAYVRQVPPVDNEVPKRSLGPIGRMLLMQGKMILTSATISDMQEKHVTAPPPGPTLEYGRYLADAVCVGCHNPDLSGGPIVDSPPEWPPASNLTRGGISGTYSEEDFIRALREGVRPGGGKLSEVMPFRWSKNFSDDEIHALWTYIQSCPPRPTGSSSWLSHLPSD